MAEASIAVDIFNPGQVFASLGFLEAAEVLLGDADGGFDWSDGSNVRFRLLAGRDEQNPFEAVLSFLAQARVVTNHLDGTDVYPARRTPDDKAKAAPCRLEEDGTNRRLEVGHWTDGSSRNNFKQFAGQQPAGQIVGKTLDAIKKKMDGSKDFFARPFDSLTPMGGSFKLDARAAWKDRDVGYSLDEQKHKINCSPVVDLLAAIGLENARPDVDEKDPLQVRYGAWGAMVPPSLARPALGGAHIGGPLRIFQFERNKQGPKGEYKQVTFATEVMQP